MCIVPVVSLPVSKPDIAKVENHPFFVFANKSEISDQILVKKRFKDGLNGGE